MAIDLVVSATINQNYYRIATLAIPSGQFTLRAGRSQIPITVVGELVTVHLDNARGPLEGVMINMLWHPHSSIISLEALKLAYLCHELTFPEDLQGMLIAFSQGEGNVALIRSLQHVRPDAIPWPFKNVVCSLSDLLIRGQPRPLEAYQA